MIYNLLLYMGIFLIVGGFCLFLYSEMKLREIDIQLFKLEQRIASLEKVLSSHAKCIGQLQEEKKDDN